MWARQLMGANASYQILSIGDSTHINDNRFVITTSTVNNVSRFIKNNTKIQFGLALRKLTPSFYLKLPIVFK